MGKFKGISAGSGACWLDSKMRVSVFFLILAGLSLLGLTSAAIGAGSPGGEGQRAMDFSGIFMLVIIFLIFYFLLIRPQQKKAREHQNLLKNLRRGDEVITSGGIYGRIFDIDGPVVQLEIAEKVRIRIAKEQIAALRSSGTKESSESNEQKAKVKSDKKKG